MPCTPRHSAEAAVGSSSALLERPREHWLLMRAPARVWAAENRASAGPALVRQAYAHQRSRQSTVHLGHGEMFHASPANPAGKAGVGPPVTDPSGTVGNDSSVVWWTALRGEFVNRSITRLESVSK